MYRLKIFNSYSFVLHSLSGQRDEIISSIASWDLYNCLDKHGGQRNQGTSESNPNDISHETNGEQRQADAERLPVLRQWLYYAPTNGGTSTVELFSSWTFLSKNKLDFLQFYVITVLVYPLIISRLPQSQ